MEPENDMISIDLVAEFLGAYAAPPNYRPSMIRETATRPAFFWKKFLKSLQKPIKVFISQPMNGKSDTEILEERQRAISSVREHFPGQEIEVIDSFFQNTPHDARPLWYLGRSLELLSTADVAYFCKGWENARGCKIENECAIEYGIEVIEDYRNE